MTNSLMKKTLSLSTPTHLAGALGAVVWTKFAMQILEASYARSNHPANVFTGQTGFSGALVKEYYAHMEGLGTFGIYVQTQLIDFAFILGVFMTALMFSTLAMRMARLDSRGFKLAKFAGLAGMFGACMDVLENLISFAMLANPAGFPDWIALPYSTAAALKFTGMTLGMAALFAAVLMIAGSRIFGMLRGNASQPSEG